MKLHTIWTMIFSVTTSEEIHYEVKIQTKQSTIYVKQLSIHIELAIAS